MAGPRASTWPPPPLCCCTSAPAASGRPPVADDLYLAALPDAVVVVGPDGHISYANLATERLARVPLAELSGRPLDEALPLRDGAGNPWWACSARLRRLPGVHRVPARQLEIGRASCR